jgi:hypothetical protein
VETPRTVRKIVDEGKCLAVKQTNFAYDDQLGQIIGIGGIGKD